VPTHQPIHKQTLLGALALWGLRWHLWRMEGDFESLMAGSWQKSPAKIS